MVQQREYKPEPIRTIIVKKRLAAFRRRVRAQLARSRGAFPGLITSIIPGIQAAFVAVDLGADRRGKGFLYVSDLGPLLGDAERPRSIEKLLTTGQTIIVRPIKDNEAWQKRVRLRVDESQEVTPGTTS